MALIHPFARINIQDDTKRRFRKELQTLRQTINSPPYYGSGRVEMRIRQLERYLYQMR